MDKLLEVLAWLISDLKGKKLKLFLFISFILFFLIITIFIVIIQIIYTNIKIELLNNIWEYSFYVFVSL